MNILPTPSGPLSRPGSLRVKDTLAGSPAPLDNSSQAEAAPEGAAGAVSDRAEISSAALELNSQREVSGTPELPAERLRGVLERLSSGYYDREDVRHEVLRDIARDLGISDR